MRLRGHDELCNFVRFRAFRRAFLAPSLFAQDGRHVAATPSIGMK
jgi:hypothetical protein